jgi:ASCH domain-containing protein
LPGGPAPDSPTRIGAPIMGKQLSKSSRALDDALVAAVLPLRASRTFVFERYTHDDWEEVRSRLPEEYRQLTDQRLRERAVRLRKEGKKLRPPEEQEMARRWHEGKKAVWAYWSDDIGLEELGAVLNELRGTAAATGKGAGSQRGQPVPAVDEEAPPTPAVDEDPPADEHAIRALTVKPEPAWAIANGEKTVENRPWGQNIRERIAIHCGDENGAIIAVADVVDVVTYEEARRRRPDQKTHIFGPLCWLLDNVRRVEPPIPCKGKLGIWRPSAAVAQELQARGFRK